jgi:diacylglycerol kinase family enzyme
MTTLNNQHRRVVLISNPRSSNYRKVARQVIGPLRQLASSLVEYKIVHTFFEDNVERIGRLLQAGDLVVAAGGDGTAAITANAIMKADLPGVVLGVLGYGNFNDLATSVSGHRARVDRLLRYQKTLDLRLLEVAVNGEHFRYSTMYADIGLVAGAVNEFEKGPERHRLRHGWANQLLSFLALVPYYLKHRKHYRLPASNLDRTATDFFAINGPRMAKFKTCRGFLTSQAFGMATLNTEKFGANLPFIVRSVQGRMPLNVSGTHEIVFDHPASLDFQADGEYRKLEKVTSLKFSKATRAIKLVRLR